MVHAFIMVKTGAGESERLLGPIRDFETVTEAHIVAGAYDVIAEVDAEQAGDVYDAFHAETDLGYTRYTEIVNKLDDLGLIEAEYADVEGRGRSRTLTLAYDAEAVVDRLE